MKGGLRPGAGRRPKMACMDMNLTSLKNAFPDLVEALPFLEELGMPKALSATEMSGLHSLRVALSSFDARML